MRLLLLFLLTLLGATLGLLTFPILGPFSLLAAGLSAAAMLAGPAHSIFATRAPMRSPRCPSCGQGPLKSEVPGEQIYVARCAACDGLVELRMVSSQVEMRPDMAVLERQWPSWWGRFTLRQDPPSD